MSLQLRVCPFSLAVFFGTVAYCTYKQRQAIMQQQQAEENDDTNDTTKNATSSSTTSKTTRVVFVLGGPGSGKGTQCQLLEQRLGWKHLSAGDLLRAERKKGGELGDLINARIAQGALVPSEVTCQLLLNGMRDHSSTYNQFLIDGFPRSIGNLEAWETLTTSGNVKVEFVLCLECPEEVMTGRLLERGKAGSGRVDDADLDVIRKRFVTFQRETQPILDYYDNAYQNKTAIPLHRIASDQPVEQVYEQLVGLFQKTTQ